MIEATDLLVSAALGIGGMFIGASLATNKWRSNAHRIQMLEHDGQFYKVVKLGDRESTAFLKVHVGGDQ